MSGWANHHIEPIKGTRQDINSISLCASQRHFNLAGIEKVLLIRSMPLTFPIVKPL